MIKTLEKTHQALKQLQDDGYLPSEQCVDIYNVMGSKMIVKRVCNGYLELNKVDGAKEFDIKATNKLRNELLTHLNIKLKDYGYTMTHSGETFFMNADLKALLGLLQTLPVIKGWGND